MTRSHIYIKGRHVITTPSSSKTQILSEGNCTAYYRSVGDLDFRSILGKKGTRDFDRITGISIVTAVKALQDAGKWESQLTDMDITIGTDIGCLHSITEFTKDTFREEVPYMVNPAHFPNTVMNCVAGRSAIYLGAKGKNTTISSGRLSFHSSLKYAFNSMKKSGPSYCLVGACEEANPQMVWIHSKSQSTKNPTLNEAFGMFYLEKEYESRGDLVRIVEVFKARSSSVSLIGYTLRQKLKQALGKHGWSSDSIDILCLRQSPSNSQVAQCVLDYLDHEGLQTLNTEDIYRDSLSSEGALQLNLTLEIFDKRCGRAVLISYSESGSIALVLLEKGFGL